MCVIGIPKGEEKKTEEILVKNDLRIFHRGRDPVTDVESLENTKMNKLRSPSYIKFKLQKKPNTKS